MKKNPNPEKQPNRTAQEPSLREQFSSRAFRAGTYSVCISLLAVVAVVILNLIFSTLPQTYTNLDLTDTDVLALSEQTKQLVSGLEEDVTVYLVLEQEGNEDEYIQDLLERYSDLSGHFHYETVNVVLYPNFISQYTDQALYENSLVVVSDKRSTVIDYFDIYQYSFAEDATEENLQVDDIQFYGEEKLTTAVDFVTTDVLPVVYTLTGHGEAEFTALMQELIAGDNIELRSLSLVQEQAVPADSDLLVIYAPAVDISDEERELILSYLEGGGALLLISDYTVASDLPNLYEVMDYYGLETKQTVVQEGNSSYYYSSNINILPQIADHEINSAIRAGGYFVMVPIGMPIYEKQTHRESLVIEPLLTTTEESFAKEDFDGRSTNEREDGDETGPFNLAVAVSEEHDDVVTQLVWVGSGKLLDETINTAVSGTNNDFILACMGWMTGSDTAISIHSKSVAYEYLNVSASSAVTWLVVFAITIPVLLLAGGGVILYRRRKH